MKELITLQESQSLIAELREKYYYNRDSEFVTVEKSLNRELAEDVVSEENSPPYHMASYDGFAIRHEDSKSYPLKIVGSVYAGTEKKDIPRLRAGEAVSIATGAYLPDGADCVLKLEDSEVKGENLYGKPVEKWTKVVKAGSNYRRGEIILRKKTQIRPQEIGILYGAGVSKVKVYKKPNVAVISTGDEVHNNMIIDTNAPMIMACLKEWGCDPLFLGTVPDDLKKLTEKLLEASKYDVIITSGGVSVGNRDYVLKAIMELGTLIFYRVRTRPGKPLAVGIIESTPIFALPGKPTGAFVAAELNLQKYFLGDAARPVKKLRITENIKMATEGFANIVFVQVNDEKAIPIGFQNSHMQFMRSDDFYNVSTIASSLRATVADGYVITERNIEKGEVIEVNLF